MGRRNDIKYQITICNWEKYQRGMQGSGVQKRRRSWIAISVDLFSDPDFFEMDQVHRNAWVGLLCHAGKVGPVFDLCPSSARVMFQLRRCPDFDLLQNQGFIRIKEHTDKTDRTDRTDSKETMVKPAVRPKKRPKSSIPVVEAKENSMFDSFWSVWPKKVKRTPSRKKWVSMKLDKLANEIIKDVEFRVANDVQWKRGYIPDPLTYLNQRRWEDEMIQTQENEGNESYSERTARAVRNLEEAEAAGETLDPSAGRRSVI